MQNIYEKKTKKGLIRVKVFVENDTIKDITIEGDFFIYPEDKIWELEEYLKSTPIDENIIKEKVNEIMKDAEFVGSNLSDFYEVIINAVRGAKNE
ncbi:MAG: lipoate protein ligase C-terminal domain-containing protein [Thermoplasmata archaeon]